MFFSWWSRTLQFLLDFGQYDTAANGSSSVKDSWSRKWSYPQVRHSLFFWKEDALSHHHSDRSNYHHAFYTVLFFFFFISDPTSQLTRQNLKSTWLQTSTATTGSPWPEPEVLDQNQKSQIPLQKKLFLTEDPKSYNFPVLSLNMFLFIYLCF